MAKNIILMLLGGAKRVTLVEQIKELTKNFLNLEIISVEKEIGFYPISSLGKIIKGPKFETEEFDEFLIQNLLNGKTIPIACMDKATISLAKLSNKRFGEVTIVASKLEGAYIALNKIKTAEFCKLHRIPHPKIIEDLYKTRQKIIAKPIEGFGSKNIYVLENEFIEKMYKALKDTHIFQEYIDGIETTHDVYIDLDKKIYVSSRDRLAVVDGEVDHCIVRMPRDDELGICKKVAESGLFWGPLTIQTIRGNDGPLLIEINARLAGGVTASIAAGFPTLELFFKESIGIEMPIRKFRQLEMKRARRDFYRFIE